MIKITQEGLTRAGAPLAVGQILDLDPATEAAYVSAGKASYVSERVDTVATRASVGKVIGDDELPMTGKVDAVTGGIKNVVGGVDAATLPQDSAVMVTVKNRYPFGLLSKVPNQPVYVGTEAAAATGDFGRGLVEYTLSNGQFSKRKIADAKAGLPVSGGAAMGDNAILGAWCLKSGAVLFAVRFSPAPYANRVYLFRTNVARDNFGSGTTPTDKRAVLNVGERGGVHPAQIRILHQRSICEARVAGQNILLFAEYSTADGRVDGGANDWVRLLKSTDDGITWSTLIEFNVDGTHRSDHFHFVVQNPYTGTIYIGSGDDKQSGNEERFVLTWDGVSAAPPANTPPQNFSQTAGWGYVGGTELVRLGDLLFYPDRCIALPDCDTEGYDTTSNAFAGVIVEPALRWVSRACDLDRVDRCPPIIGAKDVAGNALWAGFIQGTATDKSYYIWASRADRKGEFWNLAARIKSYAASGGMPFGFWYDDILGGFVFSGVLSAGFSIASAAKTISEGQNVTAGTLVLTLSGETSAPYLDGDLFGQ